METKKNNKIIIHFIHELTCGGAENIVKDYAIELKKRGYDVRVLVLYSNSNSLNEQLVREMNIPIIPIIKRNLHFRTVLGRGVIFLIREIKIYLFLKKYLKKIQPDIIHIHLHLTRYIGKLYKYLPITRIFYTCHAIPERLISGKGWRLRAEKRALSKLLEKNNTRIIALHQKMADEIDDIFKIKDTVVLENPIDVNRFIDVNIDRIEYRNQLGIPSDSFVIGHVGRFNYVKNHEWLIKVFQLVLERKPNAFLLMVGDGELKEYIREKLEKANLQGHYLILSNRGDIPEIDACMDVFCFPSLFEGLGLAVIEAQGVGLRCVIADTVPEEVAVSQKVCRLPLNGSVEEWAEAIINPIETCEPVRNLADYELSRVVDRLESLYFRTERG